MGSTTIALFEPGTNMVAWLTTILRNHFLSECRRARYRLSDPIEDHAETLSAKRAEAVQALVRHGLEQLGLRRIVAPIYVENVRSQARVLFPEKLRPHSR